MLVSVLVSALFIQLMFLNISCAQEHKHEKEEKGERGEHAREVGEKGEGEEDGTQFGIKESYEGVRRGVHMTLIYNAEKDAFVGVVKNITKEVIPHVRVEVHLSNGVELGPTPRADLAPGKSRNIVLSVEGNKFKSWSTHAESGNEEGHGSVGEGHEGREKGEHGGKKEGKGEHK